MIRVRMHVPKIVKNGYKYTFCVQAAYQSMDSEWKQQIGYCTKRRIMTSAR